MSNLTRVLMGGLLVSGCMTAMDGESTIEQFVHDPPPNVTATATSPTRVTVSWDAVPGGTKYYVYQSDSGAAGPFTIINTARAPSTSLPVANLTPGTTYCYVVRTDGPEGPGADSTPACLDTPALITPGTPGNVAAMFNTDGTRALVSWDAVGGAVKYYVYESGNGAAGPFSFRGTALAPETSLPVAHLTPGEPYCWAVQTQSSDGVSALSTPSCGAVSLCGNGTVDPGEQCDDGNTTSGDGCSATCEDEAPPMTGTLFFSEYVEGSSSNKALEIKNPTSAPIDLAGCAVRSYVNGGLTPSTPLDLSGTIAAGDVLVLCNTSASATLSSQCDQLTGNAALNFNGDDTIELVCNGTTLDVIGQIGTDPGTGWGSGDTSTLNRTIRRQCGITSGDTDGSDAFDPATEWVGFPQDTFDGLGDPACAP